MIRIATAADFPLVNAAAHRMWALNGNNQMKYTDEAKSEAYLYNACAHGRMAIVDDTFGIMFDVGAMWYSSHNFLIEECMLRLVKNDIPVSVAIEALDVLKAQYDCVMIVVGDTQVGRMTPHYTAAGYRLLGTQLIKD
jgi:hypothetical protein